MDYYKLKVLNNKKSIFIIFFITLIVGAFAYYYFFMYDSKPEIILEEKKFENNDKTTKNNEMLYVDIKGYVNKPGVYSFLKEENARVNDLILKAGGLKKDADTSLINLSKKLDDEMAIIIYSKKEIEKYSQDNDTLKKQLEICQLNLKNNACIEEKKDEDNQVNINTASLDVLVTLSGIGEVKAKAIIEYRKITPFKTIEDIKNVEGISQNLFESIKNNITV